MPQIARFPEGEMCEGCACRKGTFASSHEETQATFRECVRTGEPFYCHESTAVRDDEGFMKDRAGNHYHLLPESSYRLCRGWIAAINAVGRDTDKG